MTSAVLDLLAGLWMVMSAIVVQHGNVDLANSIACGLAAIGLGLAAFADRRARPLELILGAWLLVSTQLFPLRTETSWSIGAGGMALLLSGFARPALGRR